MEGFYIAVLTIAAAILILILTTIGVAMRKGNQNVAWPPGGGRCPNGWTESNNKCYIPMDGTNSGTLAAAGSLSNPITDNNSSVDAIAAKITSDKYEFASNTFNSGDLGSTKEWSGRPAWRFCGDATIVDNAAAGAKLKAKPGSDFKYFRTNDQIAIELLSDVSTGQVLNGTLLPDTKVVPEYQYFLVSALSTDAVTGALTLTLKRDSALGSSHGGSSTDKPKITTNTLTAEKIQELPNVKYFGKRIAVNFEDELYNKITESETRCIRKVWANANKIEWDGVSDYNKCQ